MSVYTSKAWTFGGGQRQAFKTETEEIAVLSSLASNSAFCTSASSSSAVLTPVSKIDFMDAEIRWPLIELVNALKVALIAYAARFASIFLQIFKTSRKKVGLNPLC